MDKDYKKLYEDALLRARDLHDNHALGMPFIYQTCEEIFPELRESEDEKIRKELLEHCINRRDGKQVCVDASDYRRWAAWLEKQGKHANFIKRIETKIHKNAYHLNKRFNEDQKIYYVWYNPSLGQFLVIDHYYRENYDKYNIMLCSSYDEASALAFCMNNKLSFEIQERKLRLCQFETLPKEE